MEVIYDSHGNGIAWINDSNHNMVIQNIEGSQVAIISGEDVYSNNDQHQEPSKTAYFLTMTVVGTCSVACDPKSLFWWEIQKLLVSLTD